ncbi:ABC transporter substrate-binding protein [Castellaniella sp. WN]
MNKIFKRTLGLALASMAMSSAQAATTYVYCSEGSPEGFNAAFFTSGTTNDATHPIFNRLVEFKAGTTEIVPGLAESWDVSEDGKVYTFHLRQGVKFHQSKLFKPTRDFNADDVLFSFLRQKDEDHPFHKVSNGSYAFFSGMGMGALIDRVEKGDDHTVRFVLNRPEAPFIADLGMDFASILSAEYADVMMKAGTPTKVDTDPIGTGPFEFVAYQKDSRILYKAFKDYWGDQPKIGRLVFAITPDASVRYAKLQKNECQSMLFPNPADLSSMRENRNIQLLEQVGMNVGFLSFNTEKKPYTDVRVRQALSMAIDKPAIIAAIFQGAARPAKNPMPPTVWGYNDAVQDWPYDLDKAKALLAEAGYPDGFETDLWAMPVSRPYNPNARRMAEMIQSDWAKIGVKAKIVTYEWGEYLKRTKAGEHQVMLTGWTGDNGDPDNFLATQFSCVARGSNNYSFWCDQTFENLIQQARATFDRAKRVDFYEQAQVILHEQAPAVMIAHSTVFEPLRKNVRGYVISPMGRHIFDHNDLG